MFCILILNNNFHFVPTYSKTVSAPNRIRCKDSKEHFVSRKPDVAVFFVFVLECSHILKMMGD